jgi:hypothetical protein
MTPAFYSSTVPPSNGSFSVPPAAAKQPPQAPPQRDPYDSARHIADVLAEAWVRILERRWPNHSRTDAEGGASDVKKAAR